MSSQGHEPPTCFKVPALMEKNTDFLTALLKGAVFVFLVTSISLVLYSAFTTQTRWFQCPDCETPIPNPNPNPNPPPDTKPQPCQTQNLSAQPTNISHLLFGIGASMKTWKHRSHYSRLWWQPNITRGFVWLDQPPDSTSPWPANSPPYRVSQDVSRFKYSISLSAVRIARIVLESFRLGLPDVRWFVMGDDDTVFFAHNLVSVLSKYDHRQMFYVGANSESVEQDVLHSYGMAFGGGGFAVSYSLAAQLVRVLDGCLDRYHTFYGSDQRVWACVTELGVSLTKASGFHQIDIRGDPYGLLAAHPVAPLVSLHHLDYVKPLFPYQTQLESLASLIQAYRVDPARTMQQCFCYHPKNKWSVSISWGYTAQIYPWLLTAKDLETPLQTFQTWRSWKNGPFTFNTRPVGPNPCDQPVLYYLDLAKEVGENLTIYKRYLAESGKKCDRKDYAQVTAVKSIIVSSSKMDPGEWEKAPQRHCCEISNTVDNGMMSVKIIHC